MPLAINPLIWLDDRVVPVSGRLILLSGVGSILGPLLGMGFMEGLGIDGVLYMIAAVAALLAVIAAATSLTSAPPRQVERTIDILTQSGRAGCAQAAGEA